MPRQSTVRRLPPELREQIGALLDQGRTLDEIKSALDGLGADVSRSALGRYKQRLDKVGEKLRRSREVAEALIAKLGSAPESKSLRLNVELMQGVLTDLAVNASEEGEAGEGKAVTLDPQDAMWLSKALDHLARASKADAELTGKIREQAEAAARKAAAETAVTAARKGGLSAESADAIRREILGLK
jgi:DNA-binding transcriptional MerR regulator